MGNEVFYLEPALSSNERKTKIFQPIDSLPNLKVITVHMPRWYEMLRFKFRPVYNMIVPKIAKSVLRKLNRKIDVVWCFETNLYSNLRVFKGNYTIYHPVDVAAYSFQSKIAATADIVFSISESIANAFRPYNKNVFFINHGLSKDFAEVAKNTLKQLNEPSSPSSQNIAINSGFVGNLLRTDLNRAFILAVVSKYPTITFNIWGPDNVKISNIDGEDSKRTHEFILSLQNASNVILHGIKHGTELAEELRKCDVLLLALSNSIMYDGSNSHKIIEYLSTGKVIVSHYVSTYAGTNLFEMANDDNVENLNNVFNKVVSNLEYYNSRKKQIERIEFALKNTYSKHIEEIEKTISKPF